jgi:DNA-directed RNA polymerase subunit RPC12/RpoP
MTPDLEVLQCNRCRGAVALVDAPSVSCNHCDARVEIPEAHAAALRATREGHEARIKASQRLEALGTPGRGGGGLIVAYLAMLILPSLSVYFAAQSAALSLSKLELNVYAGLPALFPGVGVFLWSIIASSTSRRFCDALTAAPALTRKDELSCRRCAAPLAAPEAGHLVRCPYCLSDNLLRDTRVDALVENLRDSLSTLEQATHLLRVRKALWGLGILLMVSVTAGLFALVTFAQQ